MIALLPWLRLYRIGATPFLESSLQERSLLLDPLLHDVVRALARGPVESSNGVLQRLELGHERKGEVHARLSQLRGLGLLAVGDEQPTLARQLGERTPALPIVDNIELTNVCPMSCTMCPTGTGRMTRPRGHMSADVFGRVVAELATTKNGNKPLALHNLGESALHPELPAFVKLATAAGLETELSTNPGHLPLSLFLALQEAGLGRLILSLDGVDEETLVAIRGKGVRAERAFANVEDLLAHRRAHPRDAPRVLLQMVRQARNATQTSVFIERYATEQLAGVSAYVKEIDANTVEGDVPLYEIGRARRPYLCRAPWRTVVVLHNGDVVPCCHDANGAVVYGNVTTQSLAEMWAGAAATALRERLASGKAAAGDPCFTCAHRPDRYTLPPVDELPDEPLHW